MNEDRQNERDSQLSAMFDGELSAAECELLARRLARDEALRAQWSRYSMIGAALRAERGVKLHDRVAQRVQAQVAQEASYGDSSNGDAIPAARPAASIPASSSQVASGWVRFARPVFGAGIAAGVAAMSILWLRSQEAPELLASTASVPETITLAPEAADTTLMAAAESPVAVSGRVSNGEPERYTTPGAGPAISSSPPARLANYVVAHSEYSSPLTRRMALLGLVASDGAGAPDGEDAPSAEPGAQRDAQ